MHSAARDGTSIRDEVARYGGEVVARSSMVGASRTNPAPSRSTSSMANSDALLRSQAARTLRLALHASHAPIADVLERKGGTRWQLSKEDLAGFAAAYTNLGIDLE